MFTHLIDEKTHLKLLGMSDAEELYQLVDQNRSHLRDWMPWIDGTKSVEDTKNFIEFTMKKFADQNGFETAIYYDGKIAGVIGLHYLNHQNKHTSIGYWLGEEYQGKGLVTKAVQAFVDYIFNVLQFNRVEIRCATQNRKSQAIPERLGFTKEGVVREVEWLYDHYVDHTIYAMLSKDWYRK